MTGTVRMAVCDRRTDRIYRNRECAWKDLMDRCSDPVRTTETMKEYPKLPRSRREELKDRGGFVGGWLKEGVRKNGNVLSRGLGTLDADSIPEGSGFLEKAMEVLKGLEHFIYSTHSHRPDCERYRIVLPLARDVSEEEYPAVMRKFAQRIGMDFMDDSTYQANRMMFWPSCPSDGEFIFRHGEGKPLDPDECLAKYDDWHDVTQWPTSSRESEASMTSAAGRQADPLAKEGVVGAFCRAYCIQDAIAKFLPAVYEPSLVNGRYDYIPGEGSAGVAVYDDRFAYSHHATDPASSRLLNSFDLVRIHVFGNDNEGKSFSQMSEMAIKDEEVRRELARRRLIEAEGDFSEDGEWERKLVYLKSGELMNCTGNLVLILNSDPDFAGFAVNDLDGRIQVTGRLPWERPDFNAFWRDGDYAQLKVLLDARYTVFSSRNLDAAFQKVAQDRHFHPIRDYLGSLPGWDGERRAETVFIDYFGADDTPYTRAVARKHLAGAVARIMEPGTKFDSVPILNGPQGIGKSTFYSRLGGRWFSDSLTLTDMKDKAGAEKLQGYWILELSELTGMRKADIETVKSFISRTDDKYRASYGVNVESHPRQCIIVGSTNSENGFLRDITGNRRFWPVAVSGEGRLKAWSMTQETVGMIWAEALALWKAGEKLYLEGDEAAMASERQAEAMESDEREGIVRDYLDTLLPVQWPAMSLNERRDFLNGNDFHDRRGTVARSVVCNMEIWAECFGNDPSDMRKADSYEIAAIMKRMEGWNNLTGNKNGSSRFPLYGKQRGYQRDVEQASGLILVPVSVPEVVPKEKP